MKNKKYIILMVLSLYLINNCYSQVIVQISDELGDTQIEEKVQITINGETKQLYINQYNKTNSVFFYLPYPGTYTAYIQSLSNFSGTSTLIKGNGQVNIYASGNNIYSLVGDFSTNPALISLKQVQINNYYPTSRSNANSGMSQTQYEIQRRKLETEQSECYERMNNMSGVNQVFMRSTCDKYSEMIQNLDRSFYGQ